MSAAGDIAARLAALAFPLLRPALQALDAETAHDLAIAALERLPARPPVPDDPRLAVSAFGLNVPNPLGLAAGFDKNARVADAMLAQGLGFVEVGGVTPLAQPGNPRPRVFRLAQDGAVINRYGLNSDGMDAVRARLAARRRAGAGLVGVNLGANKESPDRTQDYVALTHALAPVANFLTINISSPNTPGLRDLQDEAALDDLLARVLAARDAVPGARVPVLVKIAPDLDLTALDAIVAVARRRGIDGMVVSNTTLARPDTLRAAAAQEAGGLSGRPLFAPSTRLLAQAFLRVEGAFPLIGVGGIDSAQAAWTKLRAGASLLQLYTALIYQGPGLVSEIKAGLLERMAGVEEVSLAGIVGTDAAAIAAGDV